MYHSRQRVVFALKVGDLHFGSNSVETIFASWLSSTHLCGQPLKTLATSMLRDIEQKRTTFRLCLAAEGRFECQVKEDFAICTDAELVVQLVS